MLFAVFPLLLLIFYVCLIFVSLITMCLSVFCLGFILPGTICASQIFSYYLFKYFLMSFLSLFSFCDPYKESVVAFNIVPDVLGCLHFFSFFFSIFCSAIVISTVLSSRSFIRASASVILLWIPSSALFISVCLFFSSCRSLVNISCIFLIFAYIIFLRS